MRGLGSKACWAEETGADFREAGTALSESSSMKSLTMKSLLCDSQYSVRGIRLGRANREGLQCKLRPAANRCGLGGRLCIDRGCLWIVCHTDAWHTLLFAVTIWGGPATTGAHVYCGRLAKCCLVEAGAWGQLQAMKGLINMREKLASSQYVE